MLSLRDQESVTGRSKTKAKCGNLLLLLLFSCQVVSDSSWPHGLQDARLPCLSTSPVFAQVHVCWIGNVIQPPHPLPPTSPAFNIFQHQGLFHWVSSSHQVAKILEIQFQHQSFQWVRSSHQVAKILEIQFQHQSFRWIFKVDCL